MPDFVLLFRMDLLSPERQPSPAQMQGYLAQWQAWIDRLTAAQRLAPGGNHLAPGGRVLRPGGVAAPGPYEAQHESVAGYIVLRARDLDEAAQIAGGCPILQGEGTSVEVRQATGGSR